MTINIRVPRNPNLDDHKRIKDLLDAYNDTRVGPEPDVPLAVLLEDEDGGKLVGGLWGWTYYKWLFVEQLIVPASMRGQGVGSRLIATAEKEAVRRGCSGVWLETFTFQAAGFYQKLGFTPFGRIDAYPPGYSRIFLQKQLEGAEG